MNRIILDTLVFTGNGKEPAIITFAPGFNAITGPSNTGKTLIFQCINYALGSSKKPKSPPEAKGYTTLFLTIKSGEQVFTIERSVQSTDVRIFKAQFDRIEKVEPQVVSASANAAENLSGFLLDLVRLNGKRLKKNDRNETISLTFNILKNLLLVSESKIQSESSPIFSGITTSATCEKALFRFMLTGVDYGSVIASEKGEIRKANANARIELLNQLLQKSKLEPVIDSSLVALKDQLRKLDETIELELASKTQNEIEIENLTLKRKEYWENSIQIESKIDQLSELKNRFGLLSRYYDSDLKRLDAIIETGDALTEIKTDTCPTCGAAPENHKPDCVISNEHISNVIDACVIERQKIQSLKKDLLDTSDQLQQDFNRNFALLDKIQSDYKSIDELISSKLDPVIQLSKAKIAELFKARQNIELSVNTKSQTDLLNELLLAAEKDLKNKPIKEKAEIGLFVKESGPFIDLVHDVLKSWEYPELDAVYFSEIDQDIVIGEKNRIDEGKGYRALSHAAFIIALMNYCLAENYNHPGFLVLDSPLVTFRGADPDVTAEDGIGVDVKDKFFVALSKTKQDRQIIIIDNDDPPSEIGDRINYIHFTKDKKIGRYGFIPV